MIQRLRHLESYGTPRSLLHARQFFYPTRGTLPVWRLRQLPQVPPLARAHADLRALQSALDRAINSGEINVHRPLEALRIERGAQSQVIDTANMSITNIAPTISLPKSPSNTRRHRREKRSRAIWATLLWLGLMNLVVVLLVVASTVNA